MWGACNGVIIGSSWQELPENVYLKYILIFPGRTAALPEGRNVRQRAGGWWESEHLSVWLEMPSLWSRGNVGSDF